MSTTRLIRVHATGGPEVLRWEEAPLPAVAPGQARIRHRFAGLNFIDVYHRIGTIRWIRSHHTRVEKFDES
jgi:NADPH2:quinone reductase